MPLSPAEIDRIREIEEVKAEIQKIIHPKEPRSGPSPFAQQIILALLGFFLTALLGGALTAWWKYRESTNQRVYLEKQRALDRAYGLISQTSKEVATTVAAADDVVATYYPTGWTSEEIKDRRKKWLRTSTDWRVNCQVLRAQIPPVFPDPEVGQKFDQIMAARRQLGNIIFNLPKTKKAIERDKELNSELDKATALSNQITQLLYQCVARMTDKVNQAGQ